MEKISELMKLKFSHHKITAESLPKSKPYLVVGDDQDIKLFQQKMNPDEVTKFIKSIPLSDGDANDALETPVFSKIRSLIQKRVQQKKHILFSSRFFIQLQSLLGLNFINTNFDYFHLAKFWHFSSILGDPNNPLNLRCIHQRLVTDWAYEQMLIGKMRTAADVLGLYLNLYAPRKLNPIDRIKFLELESQTGLPNGTMASILASGGKPKKSWILYKDAVTSTVKRLNPALSLPFWNNDKLSGKKIVFRREPGPSDEILYASIFNEVIADGCEVIIEADKRLTPLFARSFPKAEVVPRLENSPHPRLLQKDIDFQANFSDPFGNYRDHISKFPDHGGYLIPNPEKVLFWKKYLNKYSDFPRIGISWGSEGSPIWTTQLSQWEYILTQSNVHFFNLEYSDATEDLTWASEKLGANIHTPEGLDLYNDLEGLAALISNLDLIITISNVNSLLGGALNIPTWVICPNFWYYLFDTDIYHFFPRSRVFTWVGNNNPKTALDDAGKDLNKILRESDHSGKRSDSFQNLAFRQIDN